MPVSGMTTRACRPFLLNCLIDFAASSGAQIVKKPPNKKDVRKDLEKQVEEYLREGGEIKSVDRGISGYERNKPWSHPFQAAPAEEPKKERTPVPEVVAAIEARRHKAPPKPKRHRPRKKWIYDDFGEPVRWVWEE